MKIRVIDDHCKGCFWLLTGNVCPFKRCVRGFGWVADKKSERGARK
ncbi:hypothetical protein [Anoxybacillus phage A403]|uniref:Uncharacterized protein n=1 Tax=Anoxybacillus phage A403 TaxID=2099336 RepID=A0A2P1JTX7_9CAUD|nr:hypothetical protein HWB56_gp23 [Anoxybacillus phage A403]AVO22591.1 hypothetical protein [Anoxybacillus phage A403]